jgi:hypothetical protein
LPFHYPPIFFQEIEGKLKIFNIAYSSYYFQDKDEKKVVTSWIGEDISHRRDYVAVLLPFHVKSLKKFSKREKGANGQQEYLRDLPGLTARSGQASIPMPQSFPPFLRLGYNRKMIYTSFKDEKIYIEIIQWKNWQRT